MTPAQEHRYARRRRIVLIRKRVTAISIAIFIALFSALYVQMARGNDPVLGAKATAGTAHASTKAKSSSSSGSSADTSSGSGAAASGDTTSQTPPSAVTTSQS